MLNDLRYAARQVRKRPGFALVATATLGLGIGLAAAMFGLIQGVLLTPPPYADPDRLVLISPQRSDGEMLDRRVPAAQWLAWREAQAIEPPALYRWTFNFLVVDDGSASLGGMVVTPDYFRLLGLTPVLGRVLTADDAERPKVPARAVLIGHDLWQRRFAGRPDIVGQPMELSRMGTPLTIVGVMPPDVRFLPDPAAAAEPNYDLNARVDFWLAMVPDETRPTSRPGNALSRLRPGATVEQARAEVAALADGAVASEPDLEGQTAAVSRLVDVLNRDGRALLVPLFGAVMLVFLIACANVSGLLLARGFERQQEYAMRSALGAPRWRLIRQVLAESLMLALASAAAGVLLAWTIIRTLEAVAAHAVPRLDAVGIGTPLIVFAIVATVVAALASGVLPALRTSARRQVPLSGARGTPGRTERRWLGAVATVQVVLTVALLAGAALLVRSARNLDGVRPGFETDRVLAMTVTAMPPNPWMGFHRQALDRVAAIPGVSQAAFAWGVPLTGNKWPAEVEIPGRPGSSRAADQASLPLRAVTPAYFDVFNIALVSGRVFRDTDDEQAPAVAIVNEALERRYFPDGGALGRRLHYVGRPDDGVEIVGVVADTRTEDLSAPAEPEIYLPLWRARAFSKHLVVRTVGEPLAVATNVRAALGEIDPTAAVESVTTMADIRQQSLAPRTFALQLLSGFAAAATLLAAIGLYGVLALSVGARTKEIAVRRAVGAQRRQVMGLVAGDVLRIAVVGLAFGVVAAIGLGRALQGFLYGVRPADPLTLAAVAAILAAVAVAAAVVPARRAGRVDPMAGLREP